MSTQASDPGLGTVRLLGTVGAVGVALGVGAQFLRQVSGPLMALGGATAPWVTVGFLLAIWVTRRGVSDRQRGRLGIATLVVYLALWLIAYHLTFSVRELIAISDAWREAAPWILLSGPAGVILGSAAAATHRRDWVGDVSLALPIAWSVPEVIAYTTEGWAYALLAALPTSVLAAAPLLTVSRWRDIRPVRVLVACGLFALGGLALVALLRNIIHSY